MGPSLARSWGSRGHAAVEGRPGPRHRGIVDEPGPEVDFVFKLVSLVGRAIHRGGRGAMDVDGWHPDPYGIHEERLFKSGEPTPLVRDQGIGSVDAPALADTSPRAVSSAKRPVPEAVDVALASGVFLDSFPPSGNGPGGGAGKGPARPWVVMATVLIGIGVIVGLFGIHGGGSKNAETTTTVNPLAGADPYQPPPSTTVTPPQPELQTSPTTDLSSIEQALLGLPRSTTPPPATAATTSPTTAQTSPSATSQTTTRVTQPAKGSAPTTSPAAPTTLPPSPTTTSVSLADEQWYMGYGSAFNTLQTDVAKITRALASSTPSLYVTLHPYWQELSVDANAAMKMPPIPDGAAQSEWASALGDLSEGATECILGSTGATSKTGFVPALFNQGAGFISAGTTLVDGALGSVQSQAAATSGSSQSQVVAWVAAHGAVFSTVQNDVNNLNAAFAAAGASGFSSVTPYWQQLSSDAESALSLPAIPDPLIQSYWATTLNDLIEGSSDCLASSEAPPPSVFDQGVASIDSGASYLSTSISAVQRL